MKISNKNIEIKYYVYILMCENNILYTGVSTDYKRRFSEHKKENGNVKGAKFTKSHIPEKIVALWETKGRSSAQKLETRIKQLKKVDKQELIADNSNFSIYFRGQLLKKDYKRIKKF